MDACKRRRKSDDVYAALRQLFEQADDRYNSGIFHFRKERGRPEAHDVLTPTLTIDNQVLGKIVAGLYYPDSPYEFGVLSADILGQVYEQFLGKVIQLTPQHRAKVEAKPEVKKAGGVYYTPVPIVNFIVSERSARKSLARHRDRFQSCEFSTPPAAQDRFSSQYINACWIGTWAITRETILHPTPREETQRLQTQLGPVGG